jgi:hypothetical protein
MLPIDLPLPKVIPSDISVIHSVPVTYPGIVVSYAVEFWHIPVHVVTTPPTRLDGNGEDIKPGSRVLEEAQLYIGGPHGVPIVTIAPACNGPTVIVFPLLLTPTVIVWAMEILDRIRYKNISFI